LAEGGGINIRVKRRKSEEACKETPNQENNFNVVEPLRKKFRRRGESGRRNSGTF